jgi:orotidine-5'-phosphate decarboxylase
MINVHASGGGAMMRAARDAAATRGRAGPSAPLLIAVTMLTSLGERRCRQSACRTHRRSGRAARRAGAIGRLDGVVASAHEVQLIRRQSSGTFAIVTPGIRGAGDAKGIRVGR